MSQINITVREFLRMYSDLVGSKPETQCAIDLVNQARIIAYPIGDWVGTIGYEYLPALNGLFSLPSEYEAIREAKAVCGKDNIHIHTGPITAHDYSSCCGTMLITKLYGRSYLPFQLTEQTRLKFSAKNAKDEGAVIRVQYTDIAGSARDESAKLLFRKPTALKYIPKKINRISKNKTNGKILIQSGSSYGYIEAYETNPSYSIYCSQIVSCSGPVYVRAKKKCILYTLDNLDDVLDINPEAVSSFILAAKVKSKQELNWSQDYQSAIKLGTDILKKEYVNEEDTSIGTHPVNMEESFFDSLIEEHFNYRY